MSEKRSKILVVDDEEMVREVLRRVLVSRGFEVVEAADGQAGVERAMAEPPDLILTDIRMPIRDGIWLIKNLRARAVFDSTPILVVSSLVEPENIQEGLRAGASDYVTKPFVAIELIARVEANLRTKILFDQLRQERDELKAVHDIMKEMTESLHLGDILFRLTERLAGLLGAVRCSVILTDPTTKAGYVVATREDPQMKSHEIDLAKYPEIVQAVRSRRVVVVGRGDEPKLDETLASVIAEHGIGAILVVPLICQGSVLGVLFARTPVEAEKIDENIERKAKIIAFATAGAIRNAHLYEQATTRRQMARKSRSDQPAAVLDVMPGH